MIESIKSIRVVRSATEPAPGAELSTNSGVSNASVGPCLGDGKRDGWSNVFDSANCVLETIFCDFMLTLYENGRFGDTFKMQWAPKGDPTSTKWRQKPSVLQDDDELLSYPCTLKSKEESELYAPTEGGDVSVDGWSLVGLIWRMFWWRFIIRITSLAWSRI